MPHTLRRIELADMARAPFDDIKKPEEVVAGVGLFKALDGPRLAQAIGED